MCLGRSVRSSLHMGQFPQFGENGLNVAFLIFFLFLLWLNSLIFQLFSTILKRFCPWHSKNVFVSGRVRIPWVLAPKKFPDENFWVRSDLQKSSAFHFWSILQGVRILLTHCNRIVHKIWHHVLKGFMNPDKKYLSGKPR